MKRVSRALRFLLTIVSLVAATTIGAQTDVGSPAADSMSQLKAGSGATPELPESNAEHASDGRSESAAESSRRAAFLVRLRMLEAGAVPGPLLGVLDFQNTEGEPLTVKSISITPYGRLGGLYALTKVYSGREFQIESKSWSNPLPVRIPEPTKWLTPYQMATAKTGPAEFLVAIDYFVPGKDELVTENTVATAIVGTSPMYIFVGGVVGAFLLVTFIWASKVVDCAKRGAWPEVAARARPLTLKWSVMAVAYTLNGLIVAIILWVLAAGLTTFQLPIAFQLRDFSGGLLAGLFSGMLAKSISDRLSLT